MEFRQFASPHVHPQSLDSASTPAAFAAREVALGGVALTCTDHGTLQASYPIYEIARKKKLVPIVGLEAYFRDDDDVVLKRLGVERTVSKEKWAPKTLSYADYLKYMHLTMHFRDYQAYLTAVRLLSKADFRAEQHGTERKPLFAWSDIEEIAATNATIGSGCLIGMVSRHLLQHQDRDAADAYFERLHHLFGDRLYVELFPHVCSHNWSQAVYVSLAGEEGTTEKFYFGKNLRVRDADHPGRAPVEVKADGLEAVVRRIGEGAELVGVKHNRRWTEVEPRRITGVRAEKGFIQNDCSPAAPEGDVQWGVNMYQLHLAEKYGVRVLVSDDSHFATRDEHPVQDIRLSSPHHTWKMHNSYHRYSSAEAWDYFRDRMGVDESTFRGWIDNSLEWAEGFRGFKFDSGKKLPSNFYPEDTLAQTVELITAHGRMSDDDAYRERLATEIDLFHNNGTLDYLPYFMIDEEVVRVYRNQGWLTGPGRGSAAGVYLSYLLGITHVDPLRYKLSLERFMTLDRIQSGKDPDIDQDLPFREPLEGWEVDVVEFTAEDGTMHVLPEVWKLETPEGLLTVDEAVAKDVPVYVWWRKSDRSTEKLTVLRRSRTDKSLPRWFPGWFKERFGDHIAQISVDSTLKLRAAVRDVARQRHGFVPADVEELVKQFAEAPQGLEEVKFVLGYSDDQGEHPGSIATDKALQTYAARYPEDFKLVTKCLGLARHRSQHPCAFVIADRPIHEFIPLQTVGGKRVTSFTAAAVEAVGGLKMDFLVVSNIHDIMEAIQLVRERHGLVGSVLPAGILPHEMVPLPDRSGDAFIWDLPADPEVFADFAAGMTETVFQYHTDGARDWLRYFNRKRPDGRPLIDSVEDLAIFTALDRPGPLDIELVNPDVEGAKHNALVEYTRRASGKTPSPSIHPAVARLVPETYGVMLYQEQLQRVYQDITGCTGPEAEQFRRDVAKKLMEKVNAVYATFMERATQRLGGSREDAQAVWETFETWGQYGFNIAHATCYAVIGYACAWLKRNYPLEWWCGLLRHADKDKINTKYWQHISHLVDLPDVGMSGPKWEIQNERLRAPMTLLTGIGPSAHAQLCHYAPYKRVEDLADAIVRYREDHAAIAEAVAAAQAKIDTEDGEAEAPEEVPETVPEPETDAAKPKAPRSPIHRSIVYNLAVAGALRSLFDEDLPAEEQLAAFDNAMLAKVGSKYKSSMKRTFPTLDAVARYQLTKRVLAPYGADLREMLPGDLPAYLSRDGDRMYYQSMAWDHDERREVLVEDPVMGWDVVRACAEATALPDGGFRVAVLLYVEDVRLFRWGAGKANEAMELVVDVGGGKMQVTRWPAGQDGKLADRDKSGLKKGVVVAALLQRNRADKPFSIRAYDVVRAPYDPKEE